jgi:hypothetical protein
VPRRRCCLFASKGNPTGYRRVELAARVGATIREVIGPSFRGGSNAVKLPVVAGRRGSRLCENSRDRFLPVNFSHVDATSGDLSAPIRLLGILRGDRNEFSHSLGQQRPNAAMTADNVVTFGAGDHGACSGEPNRYQAVPRQRAIGMGNVLGNSKSPTTLRL